MAGRRAVKLSLFSSAAQYFDAGVRMLSAEHWEDQYKLSLDLHNAAAEIAVCMGNLNKADKLVRIVTQHVYHS